MGILSISRGARALGCAAILLACASCRPEETPFSLEVAREIVLGAVTADTSVEARLARGRAGLDSLIAAGHSRSAVTLGAMDAPYRAGLVEAGRFEAATLAYELAREYEDDPRALARIDYMRGLTLYSWGVSVEEPRTRESALRARPILQRALDQLQGVSAYAREGDPRAYGELILELQRRIQLQGELILRNEPVAKEPT